MRKGFFIVFLIKFACDDSDLYLVLSSDESYGVEAEVVAEVDDVAV